MADFAAVLKKTLDKMGETTPEMRAKVYDKARATIKRQIEAMEKTPPQAAIDRQFEKLEADISSLEESYNAEDPVPDVVVSSSENTAIDPSEILDAKVVQEDDGDRLATETVEVDDPQIVEEVDDVDKTALEEIAGSSERVETEAAKDALPYGKDPLVSSDDSDVSAHIDADTSEDVNALIADVVPDTDTDEIAKVDSDPLEDFLNSGAVDEPETASDHEASISAAVDDLKADATGNTAPAIDVVSEQESTSGLSASVDKNADGKSTKRIIIGAALLAILGGTGYFLVQNQDKIDAFWSEEIVPVFQDVDNDESISSQDAAGDTGVPVRTVTTTDVEAETPEPESLETPPEGSENLTGEALTDNGTQTKFTQRLTEDGTEVDDGPARDDVNLVNAGEGSSIAQQTAGTADETIEPSSENSATSIEAENDASSGVSGSSETLIGQRAIFYEERTGTQNGTALAGATVWSVVNASPGGGLAVEPAIRAETSIPELGISMEMTLRRNGDTTFPASHIIELFFRVPDTFEGRGIADVQRVTFKANEQDPGNALIAVPAPIDQNIFLVALTDATTAVSTNVQLMQRESWIDIPLQYTSGRRALITFEKGAPGNEVFNEVFAAWDASPLKPSN